MCVINRKGFTSKVTFTQQLPHITHLSVIVLSHVVYFPPWAVTLSAASFRASLCRTRSVDKLGVIGELRL